MPQKGPYDQGRHRKVQTKSPGETGRRRVPPEGEKGEKRLKWGPERGKAGRAPLRLIRWGPGKKGQGASTKPRRIGH